MLARCEVSTELTAVGVDPLREEFACEVDAPLQQKIVSMNSSTEGMLRVCVQHWTLLL